MRNRVHLLLPLSLLLTAPGAFAEDIPPPSASSDAPPAPVADSVEAPAAAPASENGEPSAPASLPAQTPAASPPPPPPPKEESSLRRVLSHSASEARLRRYGESAVGITAAGALLGVGFAAEGPDMTWSHALWVASGITALGSLGNLFVPSELEALEQEGRTLSEGDLERRWGELAHRTKVMRRVGAVLGGLVGATSITLGVLAFEGELFTVTDDQRLILGSVLVAGGAVGISSSAVEWFVPTPIERGFALASSRRRLALSGAPSPSGFHLSLTGAF